MGTKPRKLTGSQDELSPSGGAELPERWSAQRKTEVVLRLLQGEALDAVSRDSQVPAHELESWNRVFLEHGIRGLKSRGEPEERELTLARAKIGELMMRLELAAASAGDGGNTLDVMRFPGRADRWALGLCPAMRPGKPALSRCECRGPGFAQSSQ